MPIIVIMLAGMGTYQLARTPSAKEFLVCGWLQLSPEVKQVYINSAADEANSPNTERFWTSKQAHE